MVKKQKKLFVWEKPQPKIRKARQPRSKKQEQQREVEFSDEKEIQDHIEEEEQLKASQMPEQEQEPLEVNKDEDKRQQIDQERIRQRLLYEEMKGKLNQRLDTIKRILYAEETADKDLNLNEYRSFECTQIRAFLNSKQQDSFSNILYIYGTPGSGKTFTIKAMLRDLGLQKRTKWINCLVMLNKSLLRYTEPLLEPHSRNNIVVIDEFDQMEKQFKNFKFLRSFKVYLKEVLTKSCVGELSRMKFIFISNKSYQSISQQFVEGIKEMIKADSITQIPFLPYLFNYTPSDIFKILKKKVEEVRLALGGEPIFSDTFLQLTSKREYSNFQDVRKIINYIYSSYQSNELKKLPDEGREHVSMRDSNPIGLLILSMSSKQKTVFQRLLKNCELSQDKSPVLVEWLYKQGSKCQIASSTIDLWLREWSEGGLLALRPYHREGHHLYRMQTIQCHITYEDNLRYFH